MAEKLVTREASVRTCEEHDRMVDALCDRDRAAFIRLLDEHRRSVVANPWHDSEHDIRLPSASLRGAATVL